MPKIEWRHMILEVSFELFPMWLLNLQMIAIHYALLFFFFVISSLIFLDINITNTINNKYELKVHRNKTITNIHIRPTLCIELNFIKSAFKDFLDRAHQICSEKYIKEEERFFINIFQKNTHRKLRLY